MRVCGRCKANVSERAAFCMKCGAPVPMSTSKMANSRVVSIPGTDTRPSSKGTGAPHTKAASSKRMEVELPKTKKPARKHNHKMMWMWLGMAFCLLVGVVGIVLAVMVYTMKEEAGKEATTESAITVSETQIVMGPYRFTVPGIYQAGLLRDNAMLLTDSAEEEWSAVIGYMDGDYYAEVASFEMMNEIAARLMEDGVAISAVAGEDHVLGIDFYYVDVEDLEGVARTYVFSQVGEYCFNMMLQSVGNVIDHAILQYVAEVLNTAEDATVPDFLPVGSSGIDFEMLDFSQLINQ